MFGLVILGLMVGLLLVVPILILGVVLRLVIGLAVLPVKLAAVAVKLALGLVVFVVAFCVGAVALALVVAVLGATLLLPLLPLVLLAGAGWIAWRVLRGKPRAAQPTY